MGVHTFQLSALRGMVAVLEFLHDRPHLFHRLHLVLVDKSKDHVGANKRAACSLHIGHAARKAVGHAHGCSLVETRQVAVSRQYRLGTIEFEARLLLGCNIFS